MLKDDQLILLIDKLKKQVSKWKIIALIAILAVILSYNKNFGFDIMNLKNGLHNKNTNLNLNKQPFIARLTIDDKISTESMKFFLSSIEKISNNKNAKAILISVNSGGGSAIAGADLYEAIKETAEKKPIVVSMRGVAASAAYLASIGANQVFAYPSTITGSIGALLEYYQWEELAKKIGFSKHYVKSAEVKGGISPYEKPSEEVINRYKEMTTSVMRDFKTKVQNSRKLSDEELTKVATGEVFSGLEALELKLIDKVGTEKDSIEWLKKEYNIDDNVPVINIEEQKTLDHENKPWKKISKTLYNICNMIDNMVFSKINSLN